MRKLGVILSAYGLEDYVAPCLNPWKSFNVDITCVSFQFENFEKQNNDKCLNEIKKFIPESKIFYDSSKSFKEHDARNIALEYLKNNTDIDTILILDVDEIYTEKEIENLLNFINSEDFSWVGWAKINFKNYIFDGQSWTDDFSPPRVFKTKYQDYTLDSFYWDNDILYKDKNNNPVDYKKISSIFIPKNKLHVKHLTWLNNERSKNKIKYQIQHFGHCSYKWNEKENKVEINEEFYKQSGQIPPLIYKDIYA